MATKRLNITPCLKRITVMFLWGALVSSTVRAQETCWSEVPKKFTDLVEFYRPYLKDQKTASPYQIARLAENLKRETTEVLDQINPDEAPPEIWRCEAAMFEMAEAFQLLNQQSQPSAMAHFMEMQQQVTDHLSACNKALQDWCQD